MSQTKKPKVSNIASELAPSPMEEMLEVGQKPNKLFIGIPKEHSFQENRVPLTPQAVQTLTSNGHRVVIESDAGKGAQFFDVDYTEAGAEIALERKKVYEGDIIIKISPFMDDEIELMKPGQTLISSLHLPTLKKDYIERIQKRKVNALAFEYIQDDGAAFPLVRSMSEIAGNTAILVAADLLSNRKGGKGVLLGGVSGVPPVKVVILGAGVVGEFACRAALGLGAVVKVFDNNIYKLMALQNNIGRRIYTSIIEPNTLSHELKDADVAVGAIHSKDGQTPCIVTEQMVADMPKGSVIVDVSIDQGGCFETSEVTSHDKPTVEKYDVIHYGVPNIASSVARTASYAISNVVAPILLTAGKKGGFETFLWNHKGTRNGVYIYKGSLTNLHLSEKFGIKFTNLDLLFAANI